jgi:hypothetical protein
MAVDPLATAWAKFNWASKHMDAVDAALTRTLDPNKHPVTMNTKIEGDPPLGATATLYVTSLPRIRADCGLTLGDVIHNFRSSLDHLAWALVKIGSNPRPKAPEQVYFPMARSYKRWTERIDLWLPGVPSEYRAVIRRYQPYRRGNHSKAVRWLQRLSNTDKHRVLLPTVINAHEVNVRVTSNWVLHSFERLAPPRRAIHVGTPLVRVGILGGAGACQVQMDSEVAMLPSLGYGVPIGEMLPTIREVVLEILGTFDKLL